jgi:hypothetical protein
MSAEEGRTPGEGSDRTGEGPVLPKEEFFNRICLKRLLT